MGKTLPPRQLKLYQAIDEILWRDWDPIGVSGIDGARDEYHMYLPEVYRLALEGDRSKIVDYLFWAATDFARLNVMKTYPDPVLASNAAGRALSGFGALSHIRSMSPSKA
jgi:hypothetical protein